MGAGGSKKVKEDLDAAKAKQAREHVSDVVDFSDSYDAADLSSVPIPSPTRSDTHSLNHNHNHTHTPPQTRTTTHTHTHTHTHVTPRSSEHHDWQIEGDTDLSITELDDHTKRRTSKGSPASPKKGSHRVDSKAVGVHKSPSSDVYEEAKGGEAKQVAISQKKPISPQMDALMIVPNDQLILEDVRTPPPSKSHKKRINSVFPDEAKLLDNDLDLEQDYKHGPPGSRGGSSSGGGRKLGSGKSSRSGSGSGAREKELPLLVRTMSQEYRQNEAIKATAATTTQSVLEKSMLICEELKPPSINTVSPSFKASSMTARTPPTKMRNSNSDTNSPLFVSPSDIPPRSPHRDAPMQSRESVRLTPPRSMTPPATSTHIPHIQSPPNSSSSRRTIKSPLAASRLVVPPSPTYHPKQHEQRLHQLQLQNLSAMNDDDPLLTTPSPMQHGRLRPSLSNTSIEFEDPDGDDGEDVCPTSSSSIVERISHENASLLDLQRQRTLSSMHNAKLEMEVESLMKQLAQLDEMEEQEENELHRMARMAKNVVGRSVDKLPREQSGAGDGQSHPHPHPQITSISSSQSYHSPHSHSQPLQHEPQPHVHAQSKPQPKPSHQQQQKQPKPHIQSNLQHFQSPQSKPLHTLAADRKIQALSISPVDRTSGSDSSILSRDRNSNHNSQSDKQRPRLAAANPQIQARADKLQPPDNKKGSSSDKIVRTKVATVEPVASRARSDVNDDTKVLEEQRRKRRAAAREQFLKEQHLPTSSGEAVSKEKHLMQRDRSQTPPKSAGRNTRRADNGKMKHTEDNLSTDYQKENGGQSRLNHIDRPQGVGSSISETPIGGGSSISTAQQRQSRIGRLAHLNKLNSNMDSIGSNVVSAVAEEKRNDPAKGKRDVEYSEFAGSKASLEHNHLANGRGARGRHPAEDKKSSQIDFDIEESPREGEGKYKGGAHLDHKDAYEKRDTRNKLAVSPIRRQRVTAQKEVDASLVKMNEALAGVAQVKAIGSKDHAVGNKGGGHRDSRSTNKNSSEHLSDLPSHIATEITPKKSVNGRSVLKNLNKRHPSAHPTVSHTSLETSFDESSLDDREKSMADNQGQYIPSDNHNSVAEDKPTPLRVVEGHDFKGLSAVKRKGRGKSVKKLQSLKPPTQLDVTPPNINKKDRWSDTMDMRRMEVELLLRRPINNDADIDFTLASAEAGLIFMDELNRVAKSLNILRGTLSRWLLPYDNNTAISDQISNVHSVVDSMPDSIRGKLTEKEVHYLVSGLNSVRQLVRVKIADDNDLEQARSALRTAADFLRRLQKEADAEDEGVTAFALLQSRVF